VEFDASFTKMSTNNCAREWLGKGKEKISLNEKKEKQMIIVR
jgi:hypothetical protein